MHFLDGIKDEDMNQIARMEKQGGRKETHERREQNGGDCVNLQLALQKQIQFP
jgi:hypothetical protein